MEAIRVDEILGKALFYLHQTCQWAENSSYSLAGNSWIRAKQLIELVEIHGCGQTGGYAHGQRNPTKYVDRYHRLYARWKFLAEKYGFNTTISKKEQTRVQKHVYKNSSLL